MRLPRLLRTSSFRLTLLYAGLFGASTLLLLGLVAWTATGFLADQIDATVANELAEVRADAAGRGPAGLREVVDGLTRTAPGTFYLLQDADGRALAGNMPPVAPEPGLRRLRAAGERAGIRGRGVALDDGGYLFVGVGDSELAELREAIEHGSAAGLAAMLLLGVLGGAATGAAVLRRIEGISRISRDIMRGDLGQRIRLRGSNDEFDHLASSLNEMLDRIQTLMAGLQQVSDDIAHDLRTPLTRLRQRLELARRREDRVGGLHAALDASIADVDAILDTFGALLRIAQVESGTRRSAFAEVDLSRVLAELAEAYEPAAEEKGQRLTCALEDGAAIRGDRDLLAQLFSNLLENAIRHCPAGAAIRVEAARRGDRVLACVSDDGPGIPADERPRVLRRFHRLDASRTTPGSGLGLSLAQAVAALHDSELRLSDNGPGLRCGADFAAWTQGRGGA